MKKIFTISILLCSLLFQTNAQSYYPMPTSNTTWNSSIFNIYVRFRYDYGYSIQGDTIINTTTYHKLSDSNLLGFFREANKKVYFRDGQNLEILLYDFSLKAGDSIQYESYSLNINALSKVGEAKTIYLVSIDSVLIAGNMRARYKYSGNEGPGQCIEGIGSIRGYGFLDQIMLKPTNGDEVTFHYVKQNDTYLIYNNLSGISSSSNRKDDISVYPNPVSTTLIIDKVATKSVISVLSIDGKLFKTTKATNSHTEIPVSELPKGVYLLKINDTIRKFVKL